MKTILGLILLFAYSAVAQFKPTAFTTNTPLVVSNIVRNIATNSTIYGSKIQADTINSNKLDAATRALLGGGGGSGTGIATNGGTGLGNTFTNAKFYSETTPLSPSADTDLYFLYYPGAGLHPAYDWAGNVLFDIGGVEIINAALRQLKNTNGDVNLEWSGTVPSFPTGVQSASYTGTGSGDGTLYLLSGGVTTTVVSASSIIAPLFTGSGAGLTDWPAGAGTGTNILIASQHGVVGDSNVDTGGGTDDTVALQKLLDKATNRPGALIVYDLPASLISATLIGRTNFYFWTPNPKAGFFLKSNANCLMFSTPISAAMNAGNFTIDGGIWNGNETQQSRYIGGNTNDAWNYGMWIFGAKNVLVKNVTMKNARTFAFAAGPGTNIFFQNCHAYWTRGGITNFSSASWTNQTWDGFHLFGPLRFWGINGFSSNGDDDSVALNTDELGVSALEPYHSITNACDITDGLVENGQFNNSWSVYRMMDYGHHGHPRIDRVTFRNMNGSNAVSTVFAGAPVIGRLEIDGWHVKTNGGGASVPGYAGAVCVTNAADLRLENIDESTLVHIGGSIGLQSGDYFNVGAASTFTNYLVFLDHFTASPGTVLTNHAPDQGGPWSLTESYAGCVIDDNAVHGDSSSNYGVTDAGVSDGSISVVVTPAGASESVAIFPRLSNLTNYARCEIVNLNANGGGPEQWAISTWVNGTPTYLANVFPGSSGLSAFTIKVTVTGASIQMFRNDVLIASATSTTHMTATKFGFATTDASLSLDDLSYTSTSAVELPPGFLVNSASGLGTTFNGGAAGTSLTNTDAGKIQGKAVTITSISAGHQLAYSGTVYTNGPPPTPDTSALMPKAGGVFAGGVGLIGSTNTGPTYALGALIQTNGAAGVGITNSPNGFTTVSGGTTNGGNIQAATLNTTGTMKSGGALTIVGNLAQSGNGSVTLITDGNGEVHIGPTSKGAFFNVDNGLGIGGTSEMMRTFGINSTGNPNHGAGSNTRMSANSPGTFTIYTNLTSLGINTTTNGFSSYRSNQLTVTNITLTGSPFHWTNTVGVNVNVLVDGVSVTGTVGINGTTIWNTIGQNTVPLQNGEWTTITYTIGTPTAFWKPL